MAKTNVFHETQGKYKFCVINVISYWKSISFLNSYTGLVQISHNISMLKPYIREMLSCFCITFSIIVHISLYLLFLSVVHISIYLLFLSVWFIVIIFPHVIIIKILACYLLQCCFLIMFFFSWQQTRKHFNCFKC